MIVDSAGNNTHVDAAAYISDQFEACKKSDKSLYIHETCATDTNQLQMVLDSVTDVIIQVTARETGLY